MIHRHAVAIFRHSSALLVLLAVLALQVPAARALETGWARTEGGRMRIVIDPSPGPDGLLRGALDIELDPGWKTYWKDPGGSGIPPTIDLSGSRGIELAAVRFPPPVRVDDGYSVWAGYTESVRFALEFRASGAAELKAQVFIGICETICVPFQAGFALSIPDPADKPWVDPVADELVNQAFLNLPDGPRGEFHVTAVKLDRKARRMEVMVKLPEQADRQQAAPDLFVAGPAGWAFAPPHLAERSAGQARFLVKIAGMPKMDPAAQGPLTLVVTLGDRAIEESHSFR